MEFSTAFIFITFVAFNTYFSFRAGEKAGKFDGMVMAFRFLKGKKALRDKNKVIGYSQWPLPLQQMYVDPDNIEIDD